MQLEFDFCFVGFVSVVLFVCLLSDNFIQAQVREDSSMERKGSSTPSWIAVGSCWEKKIPFPLRVWLLVGQLEHAPGNDQTSKSLRVTWIGLGRLKIKKSKRTQNWVNLCFLFWHLTLDIIRIQINMIYFPVDACQSNFPSLLYITIILMFSLNFRTVCLYALFKIWGNFSYKFLSLNFSWNF